MIFRAFRRWAVRPALRRLHRERSDLMRKAERARARHGRVSHIQARIEAITLAMIRLERGT